MIKLAKYRARTDQDSEWERKAKGMLQVAGDQGIHRNLTEIFKGHTNQSKAQKFR